MLSPTKSEFDYYARIMDRFCGLDNTDGNLDVFVSQEIIKVLNLPTVKTAQEKKIMSNIVKNSIIMLLALYKRDDSESSRDISELDKTQQKLIQKELLSLIYV